MSKVVILDNGHGGLIGGEYQTKGKRSPNWEKGVLYEGVYNRWIVWSIMKELDYRNIPYYHVSHELDDTPLVTRVARANTIYSKNPNTYFLSIHANAGGGTGIEGFTTKGDTESDNICEQFLKNIELNFPDLRMRSDYVDGDMDKEVNYFVLRNTECPACLLELLFMDHKKDYQLLFDKNFQNRMADVLVEIIEKLYKE